MRKPLGRFSALVALPALLFAVSFFPAIAAHAGPKTLHALPLRAEDFESEVTSAVKAAFPQIRVRPLFTPGERRFLVSAGKEAYAASLRLEGVPEENLEELLAFWRRTFPDATLELSAEATLQGARPDPLFHEQWALANNGQSVRVDLDDIRSKPILAVPDEDLQIPAELADSPGRQIRVAVLDTGIDAEHPDLSGQIAHKAEECTLWQQFQDCTSNQENSPKECLAALPRPLDRDGNGYPMDCTGWSVVDALPESGDVLGSPDTQDNLGHGTHVAGVIAAAGENGIGIRGIAPHVQLIPVKVISATPNAPIRPQSNDASGETPPDPREAELKWPKSSVDLVARGMLYAIREKAEVINLSLGWPAALDSQLMREMVKFAHERGIAVIAAAGNDSTDALVQPCSYPEVICVGAHGPDGLRAHFSNSGPGVDLFAPGVSILSTWPRALRPSFFTDLNGYEFRNGTSMASPQVSGVFALLLGQGLERDDILARLIRSGRPLAAGLSAVKVDVRRALGLRASKALIRPLEKAPLRLTWGESNDDATGFVRLTNLGASATDVQLLARPAQESPLGTRDIELESSTARIGPWKKGETKTVPLHFRFTSTGVPKSFWVELQFQVDSELQSRWISVEVRPTLSRVLRHLPVKSMSIEGAAAGRDLQARSVVAVDGAPERAFLIISKTADGRAFQLLRPTRRNTYELSEPQLPVRSEGDFLVAQRYRSPEDGATRFALIFRKRNEIQGTTGFRIEIFNQKFTTRLNVIEYDGSLVPLPEKFRWVRYNGRDAIAFMGNGFQPPPSEADPWSVAEPFVDLRMYLLDHTGTIRQFIPPKPYRAVLFLPEREEDRLQSEIPVLLVKGLDYAVEYAIGHFSDGALKSIAPFTLRSFRNLAHLDLSSILSDVGGTAPAWAVSGLIHQGKMRVTRIFRNAYDEIDSDDVILAAQNELDGITRLAGAFQLGGERSYFTQTNWNLQFHQDGNTLSTSLQRFSFLPWNLFQRGFFPIILSQGDHQLPAMLVMDLSIAGFSMNVIHPGREKLERPALLQFENEPRCSWIGNPTWNDTLRATQLYSFCGQELRSITLTLPSP